MKAELKTEVCDFQLTQACAGRKGITDIKLGYRAIVEDKAKFACDDCAEEITERIAKDLERQIRARGDRVA